jgi:hypothetical protein
MSWHYLQGPEAVSWAGSCSVGIPVALSKLIPMPVACCSLGSATDCSNRSPFGMTCARSMGDRGEGSSISSPAASLAKISRPPARASGSPAPAPVFGASLLASLARYDRVSRSLKTRQTSFLEASTSCSVTLPRWGMMRGGDVWELATPVRRTDGIELGFWPTPRASMGRKGWSFPKERDPRRCSKALHDRIRAEVAAHGLYPRPMMIEWLMGWPIGWSALEPLATVKFREWLLSHSRR